MNETISVALISLGCAKNLINSEQMLARLAAAGYTITADADGADAVIVNTCGFIEPAKQEAIDAVIELGLLKTEGGLRRIIVTGCLAERYKDEILSELPEIDVIAGVGAYGLIEKAVEAAFSGGERVFFPPREANDDNAPRIVSTPPAWAYIKIAEGCDNRCAFCVIPDIRGRYRSRPIEEILAEARGLVSNGVRELIVIAQDTTRYGTDIYGKRRLRELLSRLSEIDELRWIRVHYMYPDEIDGGLLDEFASNPKLLPYFDIPVQHIDDGILKKMRRRGTEADIRRLFSDIRARLPEAVIRTSLIAGLPGEGGAEFDKLCRFLKETRIERPGVFVYSPEEGTAAADMPRPDEDTAKRRAELLTEVQTELIDGFNRSRIGSVIVALIEEEAGDGQYLARSYAESPDIDGYITVTGNALAAGTFYNVEIVSAENGGAAGISLGEAV